MPRLRPLSESSCAAGPAHRIEAFMFHKLLIVAVTCFLLHSVFAQEAPNWPRWRGPGDNGSTEAGAYPVKWDANSGLMWKFPLPGKGCSTPIVWNQRIYLTGAADGKDALLALDWAGRQLWLVTFGAERKGKHANGSGSNPSPTTDGQAVFVYYKSGTLARVDLDGKVTWKTNILDRFGRDTFYWDLGTSPVLTENHVVIAMMHHGESYLAAFEKQTGKLTWKVPRNYKTPDEGDHAYTTPIVIRHKGKEALLVWGGQHLTAHDASDGKELWSVSDFNPRSMRNWVAVGSPVVAGDVAVVPYGRGSRLDGIKLGGEGDVTATHRLWLREDTGSFVPTPAEYKGLVYLLRDRGEVECIDPQTGKSLWADTLPKSAGNYYASPTVVGGKLYAARQDGTVFVVNIEGGFEVLSRNEMGERMIASPVPVGGRILLRGEGHLFCVGKK